MSGTQRRPPPPVPLFLFLFIESEYILFTYCSQNGTFVWKENSIDDIAFTVRIYNGYN